MKMVRNNILIYIALFITFIILISLFVKKFNVISIKNCVNINQKNDTIIYNYKVVKVSKKINKPSFVCEYYSSKKMMKIDFNFQKYYNNSEKIKVISDVLVINENVSFLGLLYLDGYESEFPMIDIDTTYFPFFYLKDTIFEIKCDIYLGFHTLEGTLKHYWLNEITRVTENGLFKLKRINLTNQNLQEEYLYDKNFIIEEYKFFGGEDTVWFKRID